MSKKQILTLWVVAAVLVVALVVVKSSKSEEYESATARDRGDTLLADFPAEEVARITISHGDDKVTLVRKDGAWAVAERDDYPADTTTVNDLLRTIDEVKVTQGIEADPSFAPRFGMDPEAGEEADQGTDVVMANDAGTELAHLTFGKNLESAENPMSPFGGGGSTGRFVMNHADTSGIYVTSELFPSLTAQVDRWLDPAFLKVEKITSITVSEPGKVDTTAWKLTREDENAEFTLVGKADNETLDPNALNPLKSLFSYARFEDVIPAAEADDIWKKDERRMAVIETVEGFFYNITFAPKAKTGEADAGVPYVMTVTVTAEIPAERKKEDGESDEDAKSKDEAFAKRKTELEERLAADRKLEGRVFQVSKYTVEPLLKDRTGLIQSAPPANGQTGTMPPTNPRGPVQAVTPPIAIPPMPAGDQ